MIIKYDNLIKYEQKEDSYCCILYNNNETNGILISISISEFDYIYNLYSNSDKYYIYNYTILFQLSRSNINSFEWNQTY
jgi:hypothetical protein